MALPWGVLDAIAGQEAARRMLQEVLLARNKAFVFTNLTFYVIP
jgi:hypothetical protein